MSDSPNRRILLIDDTASIHDDFRKILGASAAERSSLDDAAAAFFGDGAGSPSKPTPKLTFEIESAYQGPEGVEKLKAARAEGRPYAVAFVDVRMPPGWDGIRTIEALWAEDLEVQTVICTAYSDYTWEQTVARLGASDRLLVLKKPFDAVEIQQLASALTEKWNVSRRESRLVEELRRAEQEARSYASSIETASRALVTAKAAAEKSSEMKADFLLRLGHQINETLRRILEQVDQLRGPGGVAASERKVLDAIVGASEHLLSTFHETLEIAMIESGKLTVELGPCGVEAVLRGIDVEMRPLAAAKGLTFEAKTIGDVPEIRTDAERLRQILRELVANAIEHTTAGGVRVLARIEATDDWDRPWLRCDVVDTGCGIPDDSRGRIFEPFARIERRAEREHAGLGLPLAKQLARMLGGDLVVDTAPGRGSTFTLTIEAGTLVRA
ncbi:MAG TPA: hybrid sensor histidine kinase/response regulator [Planctomycetota bacterium]|nr:hybrid sensor histidine kinase/response regulator [Planctomycetota bacterium]